MLGPDTDAERAPHIPLELRAAPGELGRDFENLLADLAAETAVSLLELRHDEVHLGTADEARDEEVGRVLVQLLRLSNLLELAFAQHGHPVAHRHCLHLIVRDVDRGGPDFPLNAGDLSSHLRSQLGVEVRERLVHQEDLGVAHDRPSHRHPLPLASGELPWLALELVAEAEDLRRRLHPLPDLGGRHLAHLERERDVLEDRHVRVEGVVLKHHRDVALARVEAVDDAVPDPNLALGDVLKPGDHPQGGCLAAARRADEDHELAVDNVEREPCERTGSVSVDLADGGERDGGHQRLIASPRPR